MRTSAVLLAVATAAGCVDRPAPSAAEVAFEKKHGDKFEAIVQAEDRVRRHLQWPDDAEFGRSPDAHFSNADGHWDVRGTVKAANTLGGKLTHRYRVTLFVDGNVWRFREVQIGDNLLESHDVETVAQAARREEREAEEREERLLAEAEERRQEEERSAQREAEKRENIARGKLATAKLFLDKGNRGDARKRLEAIISDYPETEVADEARQMLDGLPD